MPLCQLEAVTPASLNTWGPVSKVVHNRIQAERAAKHQRTLEEKKRAEQMRTLTVSMEPLKAVQEFATKVVGFMALVCLPCQPSLHILALFFLVKSFLCFSTTPGQRHANIAASRSPLAHGNVLIRRSLSMQWTGYGCTKCLPLL